MDLHGMKRKQLQRLCRKHGIPANLKNSEMADRLSFILKEEKCQTRLGRSDFDKELKSCGQEMGKSEVRGGKTRCIARLMEKGSCGGGETAQVHRESRDVPQHEEELCKGFGETEVKVRRNADRKRGVKWATVLEEFFETPKIMRLSKLNAATVESTEHIGRANPQKGCPRRSRRKAKMSKTNAVIDEGLETRETKDQSKEQLGDDINICEEPVRRSRRLNPSMNSEKADRVDCMTRKVAKTKQNRKQVLKEEKSGRNADFDRSIVQVVRDLGTPEIVNLSKEQPIDGSKRSKRLNPSSNSNKSDRKEILHGKVEKRKQNWSTTLKDNVSTIKHESMVGTMQRHSEQNADCDSSRVSSVRLTGNTVENKQHSGSEMTIAVEIKQSLASDQSLNLPSRRSRHATIISKSSAPAGGNLAASETINEIFEPSSEDDKMSKEPLRRSRRLSLSLVNDKSDMIDGAPGSNENKKRNWKKANSIKEHDSAIGNFQGEVKHNASVGTRLMHEEKPSREAELAMTEVLPDEVDHDLSIDTGNELETQPAVEDPSDSAHILCTCFGSDIEKVKDIVKTAVFKLENLRVFLTEHVNLANEGDSLVVNEKECYIMEEDKRELLQNHITDPKMDGELNHRFSRLLHFIDVHSAEPSPTKPDSDGISLSEKVDTYNFVKELEMDEQFVGEDENMESNIEDHQSQKNFQTFVNEFPSVEDCNDHGINEFLIQELIVENKLIELCIDSKRTSDENSERAARTSMVHFPDRGESVYDEEFMPSTEMPQHAADSLKLEMDYPCVGKDVNPEKDMLDDGSNEHDVTYLEDNIEVPQGVGDPSESDEHQETSLNNNQTSEFDNQEAGAEFVFWELLVEDQLSEMSRDSERNSEHTSCKEAEVTAAIQFLGGIDTAQNEDFMQSTEMPKDACDPSSSIISQEMDVPCIAEDKDANLRSHVINDQSNKHQVNFVKSNPGLHDDDNQNLIAELVIRETVVKNRLSELSEHSSCERTKTVQFLEGDGTDCDGDFMQSILVLQCAGDQSESGKDDTRFGEDVCLSFDMVDDGSNDHLVTYVEDGLEIPRHAVHPLEPETEGLHVEDESDEQPITSIEDDAKSEDNNQEVYSQFCGRLGGTKRSSMHTQILEGGETDQDENLIQPPEIGHFSAFSNGCKLTEDNITDVDSLNKVQSASYEGSQERPNEGLPFLLQIHEVKSYNDGGNLGAALVSCGSAPLASDHVLQIDTDAGDKSAACACKACSTLMSKIADCTLDQGETVVKNAEEEVGNGERTSLRVMTKESEHGKGSHVGIVPCISKDIIRADFEVLPSVQREVIPDEVDNTANIRQDMKPTGELLSCSPPGINSTMYREHKYIKDNHIPREFQSASYGDLYETQNEVAPSMLHNGEKMPNMGDHQRFGLELHESAFKCIYDVMQSDDENVRTTAGNTIIDCISGIEENRVDVVPQLSSNHEGDNLVEKEDVGHVASVDDLPSAEACEMSAVVLDEVSSVRRGIETDSKYIEGECTIAVETLTSMQLLKSAGQCDGKSSEKTKTFSGSSQGKDDTVDQTSVFVWNKDHETDEMEEGRVTVEINPQKETDDAECLQTGIYDTSWQDYVAKGLEVPEKEIKSSSINRSIYFTSVDPLCDSDYMTTSGGGVTGSNEDAQVHACEVKAKSPQKGHLVSPNIKGSMSSFKLSKDTGMRGKDAKTLFISRTPKTSFSAHDMKENMQSGKNKRFCTAGKVLAKRQALGDIQK